MAAEPQAPSPPPNLRRSNPDDKGGECETCTHYAPNGACKLHPPAVVDREWLCDDYQLDRSKPDTDLSRQPRTYDEANKVARDTMRAAKQ